MGKRYCVFASYSKENKIGDDILFYLKELNKITNGVVFIMDNPIDETEEKKLEGLTIYHKCEKHNEYDFGSYKRGFFYLKENGFLDDASEVIFANDSCLGPLKPLNLFIEKWEKENKPDFYGITINNYGFKYLSYPEQETKNPHMQSYFFLVTKNIFQKKFFIDFLNSIQHQERFKQIVKLYEMGLSDVIKQNGYKLAAYFDFKDFTKDPTIKNKPMQETIRNGFFIKKKNPIITDSNKNLANYYFQKSIFPYILNKKEELVKKSKFCFAPFFLIKYLFFAILKNVFKIKNEGCAKVFAIFGINFKFKRYDYKISDYSNSIKIIDSNNKTTLKHRKIEGLEIIIKGKNNTVQIDKDAKFKNSKIEILSDNCHIEIHSTFLTSNLSVKFEKENYQSLIVDKSAIISDLKIYSDKKEVLIEIKEGKISNNSAKIENFTDTENRPRVIINEK